MPSELVQPEPTEPDCLTCGACCAPRERLPEYVEVSESDIARLPERYRLRVVDGALATVRRRGGVRCVALEGDLGLAVRCRIHPERPDACRRFERGSAECHSARSEVLDRPLRPWELP